jgi:hypothetical protein
MRGAIQFLRRWADSPEQTNAYMRTALADRLLQCQSSPRDLRCSPRDIYLAPHFDDVAFSIGAFARARGAGRLLTLFGQSDFSFDPPTGQLSAAAVTALRRAEDVKFAESCGLIREDLGLPEAALRGRAPMDAARAADDVPAFASSVLDAILNGADGNPPAERPWLFAPMALGGHIDHAIVLYILSQNRAAIEPRFRLAFYEDLPYAAHYEYRVEGLARFARTFGLWGWRRHVLPLGEAQAAKLDLLRIYGSQHVEKPMEIGRFTPVCRFATPAHEALWIRAGSARR